MKTVATFFWLDQAYMARAALEGSGIRAFIPDEYAVSTRPLIENALGGVRLQVEDEDYDRAKEFLKSSP